MRAIDFHGTSRYWAPFAAVDSRLVAVPSTDALMLLDLDCLPDGRIILDLAPPRACVTRLERITCAAYRPDKIVTCDAQAMLSLHHRHEEFQKRQVLQLPHERGYVTNLKWSPSGRYVLARMAERVAVVDLVEASVRVIPCRSPAGHGSFSRTPDGQEVLFLAAPSYMSWAMIDPASGLVRGRFEPSSGFDFCHTDATFADDEGRLVALGCRWAGPTTARVYDASPWLEVSSAHREIEPGAVSTRYPLPMIFETEGTVIENNSMAGELVSMDTRVGADGTLVFSIWVDLQDLPSPGSEEDRDVREEASLSDRTLLTDLQGLEEARGAVVFRQVHAKSGALSAPILWGTRGRGGTQSLSGHRVAVLADHIEVVDLHGRGWTTWGRLSVH